MKDEIEQAVKSLGGASANKLYADLGAYSVTYPKDPARFANPSVSVPVDVSVAGPMDDAINLGKRILRRWNKVIYELVCSEGGEADKEVRNTILNAVKLNSPEALAAAITGVLISVFSVGPAVAAIVGVLFGKLLLPAAGQEICTFWKEQIE